jgi:hypothetical protein
MTARVCAAPTLVSPAPRVVVPSAAGDAPATGTPVTPGPEAAGVREPSGSA